MRNKYFKGVHTAVPVYLSKGYIRLLLRNVDLMNWYISLLYGSVDLFKEYICGKDQKVCPNGVSSSFYDQYSGLNGI
jgi:hypothetical protein